MSQLGAARPGIGRLSMHVMSNVMLGIALGLVTYYFGTDLLSVAEQRTLVADLPKPAEVRLEEVDPEAPPLDFEGWRAEDLAYWKRLDEGEVFGRLVIPRMGLDVGVVKGTTRADLRKGPGWIDWTDLPGPKGNTGIAGHRTTYGAPFRRLDRLRPGDTIRFYSPYRVYTYKLSRLFAVTPDRVDVMKDGDDPQLTLSACHPPFSARQRLIAQSKLVAVQRIKK